MPIWVCASPKRALAGLGVVLLAPACLDWSKLETGSCGDGFVGREEACDDGNRISGDGCSDTCRIEPAICGNGRHDPDEDCDDANTLDNDACIDCKNATCGDGHLWEGEEQCDDGNLTSGDGCSNTCETETVAPGPRCGDGKLDPDEVCDDGNTSETDACLSSCSWATCGDGRVRTGVEECDDHNLDNADGCTTGCMLCGGSKDSYYRPGNSHCYTVHTEPLSEPQARIECQNEGGDLWTVTSDAEGTDVTTKLALKGRYWLGLLTSPTGNSWVTGENTRLTSFAAGEPSNAALRCVAFDDTSASGAWFSEACTTPRAFVCERSRPFIFSDGENHAYKLHTRAATIDRARQACRAEGGYLAALETDAERVFVGKNLALAVWLDASDEKTEGQFIWSTGSPVDPAAFATGQPDGTNGSQQCLLMNQGDRYLDAACTESHPYLCEFD